MYDFLFLNGKKILADAILALLVVIVSLIFDVPLIIAMPVSVTCVCLKVIVSDHDIMQLIGAVMIACAVNACLAAVTISSQAGGLLIGDSDITSLMASMCMAAFCSVAALDAMPRSVFLAERSAEVPRERYPSSRRPMDKATFKS